jgi:hypothetical protein
MHRHPNLGIRSEENQTPRQQRLVSPSPNEDGLIINHSSRFNTIDMVAAWPRWGVLDTPFLGS